MIHPGRDRARLDVDDTAKPFRIRLRRQRFDHLETAQKSGRKGSKATARAPPWGDDGLLAVIRTPSRWFR